MLKDMLKNLSGAGYVEYGYGQVEPNHLSAQRTGQIYAQLPANAEIEKLEQGQFVKYDYLNHEVNFTGAGEWMLVYNEIKLYRDHQIDAEFAMLKDNYVARVYSPVDDSTLNWDAQSRFYGGKDAESKDIEKVTTAPDMYELHYNEDPFHIESQVKPMLMPKDTTMVPRVFKTNVGDIFTTNCVADAELSLGDILAPNDQGYLSTSGHVDEMKWQVVKVYTMPDRQRAVKIMRVA